jgi:hypothetical protein
MILYALRCANSHDFDSWFKDSKAFGALAQAQQIGCPICGSHAVEKQIMAPRLNKGSAAQSAQIDRALQQQAEQEGRAASKPTGGGTAAVRADPDGKRSQAPQAARRAVLSNADLAQTLRHQLLHLRAQVESSCDYVGPGFAEEARKIHYGETKARGIYGESTPEEARALEEEGVEVAQVPWIDRGDA